MNARFTKSSTDNTAQIGVNAVESIFLSMKWLFRRQTESDVGIDAHAEMPNDAGEPSGQLIALQVKCGQSYFRKRGSDFVFYGEHRHLEYWDRHSLPVFLILHNPDDGMTLWERVERHKVETEGARWSMRMPAHQTLSTSSHGQLRERIARSDPESNRRHRMALDIAVMRQVAKAEEAFVKLEEWHNKGLNFRSASLVLQDFEAEPEFTVEFYASARDPSFIFDMLFPWLEASYCEEPQEQGNGEITDHLFSVSLNSLGRAFLLVEDFFLTGPTAHRALNVDEPAWEDWDGAETS